VCVYSVCVRARARVRAFLLRIIKELIKPLAIFVDVISIKCILEQSIYFRITNNSNMANTQHEQRASHILSVPICRENGFESETLWIFFFFLQSVK
jgi:hypothetical protein